MNRIVVMSLLAMVAMPSFALEVSNVKVQPRWPWDNLTDVSFELSGSEAEKEYRIDLFLVKGESETPITCLESEPIVRGDGVHRLVWNSGCEYAGRNITGLRVRATATEYAPGDPVFLVVDLSGGATAQTYPVFYRTAAPDLSDDRCRTSEMWFRRCPAGTFTMGNGTEASAEFFPAHQVRLSHPLYMGIFEVTQAQFEKIEGFRVGAYSNEAYRATRPAEAIFSRKADGTILDEMFYAVRGNGGWPTTSVVNDSTVVGKLRNRTGLPGFDLPTEAQWEYACRGGTTGKYYWPEMSDRHADLARYVRYSYGPTGEKIYDDRDFSTDDSKGTAKVGSYPPNPWGFYDMLGNVLEQCVDGNPVQKATDLDTSLFIGQVRTDPKGYPGQEGFRTFVTGRGGDITQGGGTQCNCYWRRIMAPGDHAQQWGFRLCFNVNP